MRKKILLMTFLLAIIGFCGTSLSAQVDLQITTEQGLRDFAVSVNEGNSYQGKVVTLANDITLTEAWTPIGTGSRSSKSYTGNAFKGVFDGGNNTISGLTITSTSGANAAVGLFGIVDGGTVKNLKLTDVNINVPSSNLAGAAIGMMINGATADKITVSGAIVGNDGVGGIVGRLIIDGTISDCINNASVTSSYGGIGGIVGKAYYEDGANTSTFASVTNCTNNGTVTAPMYIGGIVGLARANVTDCTNNGAVVGGTQTGGIVGQLIAAGTISGNENKAKVSGKNHLGGIIGDYSQSSAYTYYNVSIANNINRGELAATEQCAAIMGCNNIDGFTDMTAIYNVSYYYVEGLELFGNPEDMVIDATNKFIVPVAKIDDVEYSTLAEAVEAAKSGDEIIMLSDATLDSELTLPAGITFNGNGKQINGNIVAAGDLSFVGHTKVTSFNAGYNKPVITISEGACLEIIGTGRMVIGHGCTFNITGSIEDAKTADKAALTPSLIMPGASFTGAGVTFNVTNAYIKTTASYCSSSKSASSTFDFDIENSIWEQFGKLAFESQSVNATVNFDLVNSALTTTSHLVFGVSRGEVVIDNSNVNVGTLRQIENQSTMTIKNGSVVNGTVATSSNAKNPGTIIVENATYAVTGEFSGSDLGTGTLIVKKGANVSVGSIKAGANVVVDAEGMAAGDEINFTADLSQFTGTLSVINNDNLEAKIVDGKVVLAAKPAAKIGETPYTTLEAAFKAATSGCTIDILSDATVDYNWDARYTGGKFTVPVTINGNDKTIKFTASVNDNNYQAPFRFEADATVKDLIIDMSEVTDNRFRAISSKGNLTVDGCKFIGKDETLNCRAIIFGEGAGTNVGNLVISITNSEFINWKRGITDNENAQDVKTVTITGNTLTDAGVGVSAKETVTFTGNTVAGAYVNIKSYTAGNKLAVTATGNTLEANTENAYNVIDAGGVVNAEGFKVVAKGNDFTGYTRGDAIWGEVWGNAKESFVIKVLDANGNVMGTTSLNNIGGIIDGDVNVTWSLMLDAASNTDEYWTMAWTTAPTIDNMPAKVELWVDGVKVSGGNVVLNGPDEIAKIYAAVTDASGKILGYHTDIQEAIKAAAAVTSVARTATAGTVEVLSDVTVDKWIMFAEKMNIGDGSLITLNINGVTIDGNGKTLTVKSIESAGNGGYLFYDAQNLTVKDLTINIADGLVGGIGLQSGTISNVTFNGGQYAVLPGKNGVTIDGCTFNDTKGYAIYYEDARPGIVVDGNTFNTAEGKYAITMRSDEQFTNNTITKGRVNIASSSSATVTSNDFGTERFKVYNEATATISDNEINNLVFNETTSPAASTFTNNTLSPEAQAAINALPALAGEGTEANPYTISNLAQLKAFRDDVNDGNNYAGKYVKLTGDIDLNNEEWTPIGNNTNQFQGYFDGNEKTISNLKISGNNRYVGLFGYIKGQGMSASTTPSVKDLTLENVNVSGDYYVGGLSGQAYTCNITNVTVKGEVSGVRYVGGLVGHVYTYFKDCHFIGNASCSFDALGGIAGAGDCRAYDCSVIGDVTGSNWVGGIVGNGQEGTSAVGCYVKGDVKTSNNYYRGVGGIAGVAGHGYASSEFKNNYFDGEVYLGDVKIPAMIMGLVNANDNASIKATVEGNSWNTDYYDVNTPVYVVAEISSSDASLEDWIAGTSKELTKPRNNNLVMLESDIQYVEATDIDDVTIMKFSEVTVDDILPQIEENNQVAYIDSNADGAYNEGETKYTSFADAYTAATDGQTITLLNNITLSEKFVIAKSITLDGNNKTLTYIGEDRAIDVPYNAEATINTTIKNLEIVAETANRGINYNDNGTLNVDNVTVTIGNTVDGYAINFPGLADGATVNIENSKLTSCNPLNIWGENMTINVTDSEITSVDGSDRYNYAAIQLNNEIPTVGPNGAIANGTVVTVTGGKITALDETGEPSFAVANATETGVVNISETTVVVGKQVNYVLNIGGAYFATLQEAIDAIEKYGYNSPIVIMKSFATSETATVKNGLNVTIDLNGKTITGTDKGTASFGLITNKGNLTITDSSEEAAGKITLEAEQNRGWNAYSSVISNTVGGKLIVESGTLEHLGGTDMAYGIDNLTNGKGTYAETVINGGYIKSTYRGIRQFLNGVEAQNILTVNGGTIEGANKSIWMQDPSDKANTGTLTVGEEANLIGNVYLYVTPNSTSWPVEVSIAAEALAEGSEIITGNVPAGYELQQDADGNYVVNQGVAKIGEVLYETLQEAINTVENNGTIVLIRDTDQNILAGNENLKPLNKVFTIDGDNHVVTGNWRFGRDDHNTDLSEITIKNVNFKGNGISILDFYKVTISECTFNDITTGNAIYVSADEYTSSIVVENCEMNNIEGAGINFRNPVNATVKGNKINGTGNNSITFQHGTAYTEAETGEYIIENNIFQNWANEASEGRALRIATGVKPRAITIENNVMIKDNAPEEFVKVTGNTDNVSVDENYWNGANPTSSNTPAYFLAEGVQVHNYYAAYDAESNTLSDLVTIEGAGETLEIFYTAAGEVTEQANAAYSLMFTVTDYASKEVSVKIGNKNPAENKGCDLLIPSSVKFNDQDFAVTSIPVDGFKECKGFDKLVVPGTITSVSNSAFYNCLRLTEVVIEEGVQKLGSSTFYKILDLQTLTLPSTLTRIASLCFNGTHNIETIVCNAQTPPTAFNGSFTEAVYKNALLYVDGKYEDYKAADGWSNFKNILAVGATQTIDKDRYTLIATITDVWNRTCSVQIGTAPTNTKRAELAIPEHVSFSGIEFDITSIPEGGFQDCKYFEGTLTIPAYITSIGGSAFRGCSAVTALVVEEGVTSLGTGDTFRDCLNIATITLPSTLTEIPTRCFHNIQQKLKVVECHALVPPTLASQFTQAVYNGATLYVHDVDAYKGANNWKLFKSIRLIGAVAQNKETEVEYKSIAEAVAAANAGETVQMLQNVDLENTITVAAGKEVILDLNGKTVSYTTTEYKGEAMITNNGNLTINDSAEGGKLSYAYEGGANSSYGFGNSTIENKGVLTINAGTVENTSAAMSHASYAINTGAGATLNVEGGNILNLNGHAVRMVSFRTELNTVNINGGYIEGTRALQVQLPGSASATTKPEMNINITGGELMSNEETYNLAIYVFSNGQSAENVSVEISGGTFNGNVAVNAAATNSMLANAVAITDGTFNGVYGVFSYSDEDAAQAVISIVGGTFATNYSEWYAEDDYYVFEENIDGTYTVVEQTIFTQTTQLNAGWNWFSYYVNTDLETLENELGESGIQIKSHSTGLFVKQDEEDDWYGSLETISPTEMYTINTSTNVTMEFIGEYVNPTTPIAIKYNWNAIGYMLNIPLSLDEALKTLNPQDGDYIKSKEGFAKFEDGEWEGSLETLNPGEGYMLKSVVDTERTLIYSITRGTNVETKANITTDGNYWTPNASQYPNNMTMTAMVDVEGGDYEVAAFVDGEVRGSARPIYVESIDAYVLFLTIHGEGVEEMTFKFYDLTTGEELDLNDRMNYSDNAIVGSLKEPYMFNRGTTGIGEAAMSEVNIYPNPTTTGTEINLQATCDKVEVFNALGVKLAEYQNVDSIDAIETAGIYVIRITNNGNIQNCRLVVK